MRSANTGPRPRGPFVPSYGAAMSDHPENYEDVTVYGLDDDVEHEMLLRPERVHVHLVEQGRVAGRCDHVVRLRDGKFLVDRLRTNGPGSAAVRHDPRVCIVVTSTGSKMARNKTVTYKGTCTVHDNDRPSSGSIRSCPRRSAPTTRMVRRSSPAFLDSPRRVVLEVEPTQRIGYDGGKMGKATADWMAQQQSGLHEGETTS